MAENKKSFVLYADLIHTVRKMPPKKAGELFMTILSYVNDENPVVDDPLVDLVFEPVKQQLKRDLKAWEETRVDRSRAGKVGGIKSGEARRRNASQIEANEASASKSKQTQANEAVNVSVSVNVNDTDINSLSLSEMEVGKTIQFALLNLGREYTGARVAELWQAFLINGQDPSYQTPAKRIKHFRDWLKNQPYNNGTHKQNFGRVNGVKGDKGVGRTIEFDKP